MALRLSHVLAAMAAVLLAGVASVVWLEQRAGGASVPGIVLIDAPTQDAAALDALAVAWPSARRERVRASGRPLGPFGPDELARLAGRGYRTSLFTLDPDLDGARARASGPWRLVFDGFPPVGSRSSLERLLEAAADDVRLQADVRSFLVALALGEAMPEAAAQLVTPFVNAVQHLPGYRRTAIVVLGAPEADGWRPVLRLDLGRWGTRARPELADLLEPGW